MVNDALPGNYDLNTYSNYEAVLTQGFHLEWDLDLIAQRIDASISLQMQSQQRVSQVLLDWWNLELAPVPHPCQYYTSTSGYVSVSCNIVRKTQGEGDVLVIDLPATLPPF